MALKMVRPGLYERTDAPRNVKISPQFAEMIRQCGHSALLTEIVEQAERGGGR